MKAVHWIILVVAIGGSVFSANELLKTSCDRLDDRCRNVSTSNLEDAVQCSFIGFALLLGERNNEECADYLRIMDESQARLKK